MTIPRLSIAAFLFLPLLAQAAQKSSFEAETLTLFNDAAEKVMSLAGAMPAEKYGWRPASGVRSAGETYVHIANGNRYLLTFVSKKPLNRTEMGSLIKANEEREKTLAEKGQILDDLKESFEEVRKAAKNLSESELRRPVKLFNTDTTVRGVFLVITTHISEHLGQSIAYARMNGVTPPWSAGQ